MDHINSSHNFNDHSTINVDFIHISNIGEVEKKKMKKKEDIFIIDH